MKKILAILTLIICLATSMQAQRILSTHQLTTSMVLIATPSVYAANEVVRNNNLYELHTKIPRPRDIVDGMVYALKLEVDSLSANGDFVVYALSDTAGVNLAGNHSILQSTDKFSQNFIFRAPISVTPEGSWAAGARKSVGSTLFVFPYALENSSSEIRNIYWVIKADGAWMPSLACKVTLTVTVGE